MNSQIKPKEYIPDASIHPGMSLADILETRGISQAELARRMDKPVQAINEIIMGKKEIIPDTAITLEHVLGLPASFWLKLESNYRESLARNKENKELNLQMELARAYPYGEMASFGWVKDIRNPKERVEQLLQWLGVAHLNLVPAQYEVAFRKSQKFFVSNEKLAVWLRHGEIEFQNQKLESFDKSKVDDLMRSLRVLTREDIKKACEDARSLCARYGIALIFTPEFKSFPVSGATRWVSGNALVQVSLRFKTNDHFWFSIFHELGHVFKHKRELFIEDDVKIDNHGYEKEANQFAAEYLIPEAKYHEFLSKNPLVAESDIIRFAENLGVVPGIIVGRLQHDKKISVNQYNRLKRRLCWTKN
ncbi:MAG: addiction module antidote protein, HigA family [Omnitrophica bacterium RIFCSPHIGHO2_02_FULL_51_18]|nr:MAG: addiction module antidote protein, HigA family [Omnitrophica bacterium RIFCSPHIGHO2_02_FULL_51_18]